MSLASLGVLSPDGISYSFDDRANGYSRGEGFGVVVLKRLTDAVRDGDTIRAVVRNTAANQDGRTSVITQPSGEAQVNLMRAAYETAGLDPSSTRYFEAHATGTTVGDPIEASAISRVFARYRSTDDPLYIGALKSNIGHLEGGAGVAALLKSIFVLERGVIPPNIWFQRANPKILEAEWHFKFPLEPTVWPVPGLRRASVNSFGLGGSNVHVIMDDAYNYLSSRGLNGVHRTVVHPSIVRDIIRIDRHGEPQQPGVDKDQRDSNSMDPNADDELLKSSVQTKCHVSTAKHIRVTSLGKKVSGANGQAYHLNGYAKSPENRGVAQTKQNGTISGLNGVNGVIGAESHSSNGAGDAQRTRVFVLSSFDERGVQRLCNQYHAHWTGSKPPIDDEYAYLDDLGYTLARKRSAFTWRAAIVANSLESLSKAMANPPQATGSQTRPNLALVFTGQGAQWAGMGKELLIYPVFRNSLSAADRYFKSLGCPWSLIDELNKDKTRTSINESLYSQPICSALQIAAMELLASWSISASSVIGHSSGEIAAAFAVGAISRESAWKLAYFRGLLSSKLAKQSQSSPRGMLAVALGSEQAEKYIAQVNDMVLSGGSICVACINSPRNVTISGSQDKLDFLKELLDAGSIFARRLQVDNAYHSMYMRSIADEYHEAIGEIEGGAASFTDKGCRFFSTVTGDLAPFQKLQDPAYWVNNLVSPVRFAEAASKMFNKPVKKEGSIGAQRNQNLLTDVLEVGPHGALRAPLREIMEQIPSGKTIDYGTMLNRGDSAVESALAAAGRLFCRGFPVDINALNLDHRPEAIPALLVNLPSYAFNHSETYWSESRLSKGYRFRKSVRHELLGAPIPEWNRINAVWRNHIRLSENPWAKDHSIMGSVLYPAAGMLVMAIEASLQLTNPDKKLKGFRFKDVSFHMALRIPAHAEGVETQFQMRPHLDSTSSKSFAFSEFELSSYEGDERRDHCRGLIQTEYDASPTPVDSGLEDRMFYEMCVRAVDEAEVACRNNASANQLYQLLAIAGYHFGPDFQTLSDIRTNNDRSLVATVKAPDIGRNMPHGHVQLHLIHPTTLDSVLQSGIVALTNGGKKARATMVPTFIKELWVAGDAAKPIDILRLCAKSEPLGRRQAESSITAINPATKRPLIVGDGVVVTSISEPGATDGESSSRNTCFNLDWKPDPSFVDQEIATRVFQPPRQLLEADPSQLIAEIECLCYMYMRRYMSSAQRSQIGGLKPHHQKFMTWMQNQLDRYDRGELLHGSNRKWNDLASDESYFVNLVARLGNSAPEAKLVNALGKALPEILAGDVDSLQILFEGQLINDVYHHTIGVEIVNAKLCSYLDAVAHKNPDLTILEVGAGTGAATVPIMDTLMYHGDHELGSARFRRYDFTDISPSFDNIKEMFPASLDHMHFRTLNIENDPIAQGFDAEQYDIIVASNVVHATKDIETTLRNMRKLLKPGGKLLLHEITNTMTIRQGFQFGLLPGWWAAEEPHRQQGPLLSVENWSLHLEQAGFSGVDISFNDYPEKADQLTSVMVSTAEAPAAKPSASPQTIIVADLTSALQNKIAEGLKREILQFSTVSCAICPFDNLSVSDLHEKVCIFVPEVETPFLDRMSDDHYGALQTMVNSAQGILWVGQGGGWPASNPFSDLVSGFSKVIRAEVPSLEFVTLAMESAHDTQGVIDVVARLFNTIYIKREKEVVDNAFFESDGILHIGRMIEANYMVSAIGARTAQPIAHSAKFGQEPNRALTLTIGFPGLLDTLRFDDDPIYEQPLKDNDVEFRVAASGLNFFDIMVALDQIPNTDLGLDGAGVVTRTGPGSKFKVGDRVCGIVRGSIKTLARASDMRLSKIPDELSFTSAASIPVAYTTAYAALYDSANIQKDETVLIHAAAGGVGQACIQLAQLRGAKIVATVGSVEKRDLLERKYGIPRDHILSSRDLTFTSGVKRITNGRGVDVIVNSLSGMALRETWNCIAPFGRFIELGKVDIYSSARLGMDMFRNNVSFQFIDIYYIADEKPQLLSRMLGNVMKLVCDGSISELTPGRTFLFSEIQEAFQYMRSGAHTGKIVLEAHDDDVVPVSIVSSA